jgi:site-specific recombinase XerD
VIGVDNAVMAALTAHRERLAAIGLEVGPSDTIMHKDGGEPLTPNALGCRFRDYAKRAGLTCSIHDLRHFTASVWLEHLKPVEASRAIGHARMSTTVNVYGHVLDKVDIDRRPQQAIASRVRL